MADKPIKVAVVVDPSGAKTGVKSVEGELAKLGKAGEATGGAFSKTFGSGGAASKGLDSLGVNVGGFAGKLGGAVPLAAAAAGGAIAKFALDGAARFGELGEKVETFKGISGSTADSASRWVAVADDFGVSADELAGGFGKLAKTLGANASALDEYGVSVQHAKDGSVDMNATALNVIDTYNNTVDPATKAKLATEAFGKSYTTLIPLIDEGTTNILDRFKQVDGAQLFTDKKLEEAKKYRLAMDDLHDAVGDVQMEMGQKLVPILIKVAEGMSKIAGPVSTALSAAFDGMVEGIQTVAYVLTVGLLGDFRKFDEELPRVTTNVDEATGAMLLHARYVREAAEGYGPLAISTKMAATAQEAHTQAVLDYKGPSDDLIAGTGDYADAVDVARDANAKWKAETDAALKSIQAGLDETKYKWDVLSGAVSNDESWLHLQQSLDDVKQAGTDAFDAASKGAADAEKKARDYQLATDSLKKSVIDYGQKVLEIPLSRATEMLAEIDKGSLDLVEAQLEILTRNRTVNLDIIAHGGAGYGSGSGPRAAGGPVSSGSSYLVGERGPEMFIPGSPGSIIPNDRLGAGHDPGNIAKKFQLVGGGGGGRTTIYNVYNNVATGADPVAVGRATVESIKAYERSSGSGWRN